MLNIYPELVAEHLIDVALNKVIERQSGEIGGKDNPRRHLLRFVRKAAKLGANVEEAPPPIRQGGEQRQSPIGGGEGRPFGAKNVNSRVDHPLLTLLNKREHIVLRSVGRSDGRSDGRSVGRKVAPVVLVAFAGDISYLDKLGLSRLA